MTTPGFIYITCQVGAEPAVKNELARKWPAFRFAFSRPGFLTFKLPAGVALADDFDLHSVFARAYGFSIGKTSAATLEERAAEVWQIAGDRPIDALHVWQRDLYEPGHRGYEPAMAELALEAENAIRAAAPEGGIRKAEGGPERGEDRGTRDEGTQADDSSSASEAAAGSTTTPRLGEEPSLLAADHHSAFRTPHSELPHSPLPIPHSPLKPGQLTLDCILVEPDQWWIGYHRTASIPSRWPGGMFNIALPEGIVSRAYLKMEEALAWSRMLLHVGETWAEIGSAPGGASQALLARGVRVIGIDPADMDPAVLAHPNFTHIKMRGADVRRRAFRDVRYLTADINVAPQYTLDTVEAIVTHPTVNVRGLILTLKLLEWKLADELPAYLDRIRSWGYSHVRARQLHHNRQEVCVTARRK